MSEISCENSYHVLQSSWKPKFTDWAVNAVATSAYAGVFSHSTFSSEIVSLLCAPRHAHRPPRSESACFRLPQWYDASLLPQTFPLAPVTRGRVRQRLREVGEAYDRAALVHPSCFG